MYPYSIAHMISHSAYCNNMILCMPQDMRGYMQALTLSVWRMTESSSNYTTTCAFLCSWSLYIYIYIYDAIYDPIYDTTRATMCSMQALTLSVWRMMASSSSCVAMCEFLCSRSARCKVCVMCFSTPADCFTRGSSMNPRFFANTSSSSVTWGAHPSIRPDPDHPSDQGRSIRSDPDQIIQIRWTGYGCPSDLKTVRE